MLSFAPALVASACLLAVAQASPLIVLDPPITSPTAGTVWTVGKEVAVTWNTSSVPPGNTNEGEITLFYVAKNGSQEGVIPSPLANGFLLSAGQVTITVPDVPERHTYIIDLFGDSGNISPEFTIQPARL